MRARDRGKYAKSQDPLVPQLVGENAGKQSGLVRRVTSGHNMRALRADHFIRRVQHGNYDYRHRADWFYLVI